MSLTVKTDDVTKGRKDVDPHGRFRGEWVKFKLMSLYSPIEQIPPELLLFKTIGTVLVLFDEKGFVLPLLFIVVVVAISASSFSSE